MRKLWQTLGPGMLYAGAAVGVSHLVQSTRAGSEYGWSLWWVILFSNFIKYPFFEFGPRYASATGQSLLHGYKQLGKYALIIFIGMTLLTMFAIQAAVTVVTAGLLEIALPLGVSSQMWSCLLLLICGLILVLGNYQLLNSIVKWIILVLTVTTIVCLMLAKKAAGPLVSVPDFSWSKPQDLLFVVALMGWMPAPIDLSVWHSLWSKDKDEAGKQRTGLREQLVDFNVGYFGTALLAVCFLGVGAEVLHGSGRKFSASAAGFAQDLLEMFTQVLGSWSYPIILTAALCTMLSTTMTLLDAFPRSLRTSFNLMLKNQPTQRQYNFWLLLTIVGTASLILFFMQNMRGMVDLATTISFVIAPVLAYLNTRVILSSAVPAEFRPPMIMIVWAVIGIIFLAFFSTYFLWMR